MRYITKETDYTSKETYHASKETVYTSKETYHTSKQTDYTSKETYNTSKETYYTSNETYYTSKETYSTSKENYYTSKETYSHTSRRDIEDAPIFVLRRILKTRNFWEVPSRRVLKYTTQLRRMFWQGSEVRQTN